MGSRFAGRAGAALIGLALVLSGCGGGTRHKPVSSASSMSCATYNGLGEQGRQNATLEIVSKDYPRVESKQEQATVVRVESFCNESPQKTVAEGITEALSPSPAPVISLLAGIPQSGNTLGSPTAPVTLVYYGDLECPFCKEFSLGLLPTLIQKYVRAGRLKVQYRSLDAATPEPSTFSKQQVAALAAGGQNLMWDYVELFYREQGEEGTGYVTEEFLQKLAAQVPGLRLSEWGSARQEAAYYRQIEADKRSAKRNALRGTPSFLLGRTGGRLHQYRTVPYSLPGFETAIGKLLSHGRGSAAR